MKWNRYISTIKERLSCCSNAKNTLFLAKSGEIFVGYIAFNTRVDDIDAINQLLKSNTEAYSFLTAVDEKFRGKGIAEGLKVQIFEPEHGITKFRGKMKENNNASIRLLNKLNEKGYPAKKKTIPPAHYLYSVKNRPSSKNKETIFALT